MKNSRPLVWGHRGASGYCPENTIEAFDEALRLGADGIELDVQLSKDGELVVCHDERVDRTSSGSGLICDFTLSELKEMDFSASMEGFTGVKIPTMREVFELLKNSDLMINIELKTGINFYPGIEEKIIALTEECGYADRVIFSSFNHYTIKRIKELDPKFACGFLYADGYLKMPEYAAKHGVQALHPAFYNLQFDGFMSQCKDKGIDVNVWTVNEEKDIQECCKLGVNAIITNYPDRAIRIIEEKFDV